MLWFLEAWSFPSKRILAITLRIKASMILNTFEERAGDSASIFGNSRTNRNCCR